MSSAAPMHSIALVTGVTSGLGYATAVLLADKGYRQVIVTGRREDAIKMTVEELTKETGKSDVFTPLALDLNDLSNVEAAVTSLGSLLQGKLDVLVANAGLLPGKEHVLTSAKIEASQAPLIGHHILIMGLLQANRLSETARIVVAGAEPARGGVPFFKYTDLPTFAEAHFAGNRTAAVEALIRTTPPVQYSAHNSYADAKLIIAWYVAALARRLPKGMAIFAVSPGAASATQAGRRSNWFLKHVLLPMLMLVSNMSQPVPVAAGRYVQATELGTDKSGTFYASAMGTFKGPMEPQPHPHLHDQASQEAAWQAVVRVAGKDLPSTTSL